MHKYQKSIFLYGSMAVLAFLLGGGMFVEDADAANSISLGSCSGTAFSFSVSGDGADYYAVRSNSIADPTFYYTPVASPAGNCSGVFPDVCGLSSPGQVIWHNPGFYDTHAIWAHSCWYATGCSPSATNTSITCSAPVVAPSVTTGSASGITQTSAVLNGTANANGSAGTATFMFTQSTSYPTCSGSWPWSSAIASGSATITGTGNSNYSVTLGNISAGTTYSFCAVATNSAGTTYGAVQSFTTVAAPTYTCSGTQPSNTSMWDATSGLSSPASYTYSAWNTGTQCEYYCNSGYTWNGSGCTAPTYTCSGSQPANTSMWDATSGLSSPASYTYSAWNTGAQCEYSCNSGYNWNGSSCTVPTYTCSGTQPSNTSMWDATSGLSSPASYTYSASNTGAQCEFACNSGYTWNGSSCTTPPTGSNFKICLNSCNSGFAYSGIDAPPTPPTLPRGTEITLVACSGAPTGCTNSPILGNNTQVLSNWSEESDPSNAIEIQGSNTGYSIQVKGLSTGQASVKATPQ